MSCQISRTDVHSEIPVDRQRRTTVSGEERTFDDFGEVDDPVDRTVHVGEESAEQFTFVLCELLDVIAGRERTGGGVWFK